MHTSSCARQCIPWRSPAVSFLPATAKRTAAKHPAPPGLLAAHSAACMRMQPHKSPHTRAHMHAHTRAHRRTHPQTTTPAAGAAGSHDRGALLEMPETREPAASQAMVARPCACPHSSARRRDGRDEAVGTRCGRSAGLPGADLRTRATASNLEALAEQAHCTAGAAVPRRAMRGRASGARPLPRARRRSAPGRAP
jgi:hypothetical protein